jgi:hypothetical protein
MQELNWSKKYRWDDTEGKEKLSNTNRELKKHKVIEMMKERPIAEAIITMSELKENMSVMSIQKHRALSRMKQN